MKTSRLFRTVAVLGATMVFLFSAPIACNLISGVNDLAFEGVGCQRDGDCPAGVNECQTATCLQGVCGIVRENGISAPTQVTGDCKINMCVAGEIESKPHDSDTKITATDCDEERCEEGVVANVVKAERSLCNTSGVPGVGVCDGHGQCYECLDDTDCPQGDDGCTFVVCESDHRCRPHPVADGLLLPDQQSGDCRKRVCDGAGNEVLRPDSSDVADDKNDCTVDACTNDGPSHTAMAKDTSCGNGLKCDEYGQCVGCNSDADCSDPPTQNVKCDPDNVCRCKPLDCAALNATCGDLSDGCGARLPCNNQKKDGNESGIDCGNLTGCAKCANSTACSVAVDCQSGHCVDGVCCNDTCDGPCQSCTAAGKGYPEDGTCGYVHPGLDPDNECNQESVDQCGLSGFCNGAGACAKYENGTVCVTAVCNAPTFYPSGVCANGLCNAPVALDCTTFGCDEAGCKQQCASDVDCSAGAYCSNAICRPKKQLAEACDSASGCLDGFCVDGYCCDRACTESCMACNVFGSVGTCQFVPQNLPDISTCVMPKACDGSGVCKKSMGQSCAQNADCSTGNCMDGFCCNTACAETCRACNVPGSIGTCTVVPSGQSDGDACKVPSACSGFGACLKGSGAACAIGAECTSGYCFDGVCCNSECKEACKACNVTGSVGTCTNVPTGQTDPGTCPAPKQCNGMGVCVQ